MKATDMLNKVKELLGQEAEEVKLAQATLENGTVIESEDFAVGSEVFIVTEDEKVALPVGEYTLEDGEQLAVEEEGIIASIGAAQEEAPEEEVEAADEEIYATKEELAEVKSMLEEIKGMLEPKEEMSEEVAEELSEEAKEEVELSAEVEEKVEEEVKLEKVTHNPETIQKPNLNLYGQKRTQTTMDRVLNKIANLKK